MTIHELALDPEVQEKLYQECIQLKESRGLTFDSISELKYLDCVLNGRSFSRIFCNEIIFNILFLFKTLRNLT